MDFNKYTGLLLTAFFAILMFNSQENIFFGDMVQFGSRHPHFFFENDFNSFWLPNNLDSGHPPIFGMYIALCWKLFGKSLAVSHWAMFPFLVLIAFAIPELIKKYLGLSSVLIFSLIFMLEPTLRAQASLTSPDIVLIAFFLWALVLYNSSKLTVMSLVLIPMSFVSLRGMMLLFAFYLAICVHQYINNKKLVWKEFIKYTFVFLPAVMICFYWLIMHYNLTGWIGFHNDSPWASSFQSVGLLQIVKNFALMIWRFIDFGRVGMFLICIISILYSIKSNIKIQEKQRFPVILFCSLLLIYSVNTLFADGLVGHRYYLPIYLISLLITFQFLENLPVKFNKVSQFIILLCFFFGSILIYPSKIAMGWDATPAHRPYFELREDVIQFLDEHKIKINNVAAGFPTLDSREILELNGDTSRFQSYHLKNTEYILCSNIFNYPDDLQDSLMKKEIVFEKEKSGVFMRLYKN